MLKTETKTKLKALGFDVDKLVAAAVHAEEQDFEVPTINNLSEADLATRDENVKKEAKKEGFKEGKDAGLEIAGKQIAKKYGLTDIDVKDPEKVIAAIDAKVLTGDSGLKEQIKLLQKDKEEFEGKLSASEKKAADIAFDVDLIQHFPANRTGLSDKEFLALVKMNLQFEEEDGVKVIKKDGVVLRDTTTKNPLPVKDALNNIFTEKKWVSDEAGGGRGAGDSTNRNGAGIKKLSDATVQFKADHPNESEMSPAFHTYVGEIAKKTTDFDWDN